MIISTIIASLMFGAVSTTYDGLPISNDCVASYRVTYNNNVGDTHSVLNVTDVVSFGFDVLDEGASNYIYYLKWVDINGTKNVLSEAYETTNMKFDTSTYLVSTSGTNVNYRISYDLNDGDVYLEYEHALKNVRFGTFESSTFNVNKVNLEEQIRINFANSVSGYNKGYSDGFNQGNANGLDEGYANGYANGYSDGVDTDQTAYTIFNGFLTVGMLPINVFLQMLNFEVLGINISNFVMSILTVGITIIILKMFVGKSGGGNDA